MKKLCILLILWALPLLAQENIQNLFNSQNPNIILDNQAKNFDGNPLLYIQGISDKPQPKSWMDKMKIKLFGSMEIPNTSPTPQLSNESSISTPIQQEAGVSVQPMFGYEKQVQYIPHTTEWTFIIQLMDDDIISVQEDIRFLLTQETPVLTRDWPNTEVNMIQATLNNKQQPILPRQNAVVLKNLSAGFYHLKLHYLLPVFHINNQQQMNLIGYQWDLTTDSLSGLILTGKTKPDQPQFLFGKNQQEIPNSFTRQTDVQGNIFFKNTHLIPAHTEIGITITPQNLLTQKIDLLPKVELNTEHIIFMISWIVLGLYLFACGLEIQFANLMFLLKRFKHISNTPIKRFIERTGESIIGSVILLGLIYFISIILQHPLTKIQWGCLGITALIGIGLLDQLCFYPKQKMINTIYQNKQEEK